ncbi:MAG TPA: glycosyltransferase family 1 protein [Anaeromyxobacter sp.]|nr:glycosyltransferase family 1 protein [Anaeromyxobacter sp.]
MNIGFDAKRVFHNATGLGNYARDVLRILHRHRPEHVCFAYTPRPGPLPFEISGDRFRVRGPRGWLGRAVPALWRTRGIVADLRADGIRLFHGLSNELPLGIESSGIGSVVTIHDLIFERLPELYPPIDRRIYSAKARSAVARAGLVVAISEQTRRDLVALYGVPEGRIRVVYQTCHEAFRSPVPDERLREVAARLALPPAFLLAVGTIERRKNLLVVLRALEGLPGATLVAVGRETPYAEELRAFARARRLERRVRFLSGVSTPDLAALYRLATVAVYPSLFEGFGIPIVEALFSGTPVVTTRGGVFPEAGGPGSAYVDPHDADALREALAALLADGGRRAAMRAAGLRHAARFSEEAIADGLSRAYEDALRA